MSLQSIRKAALESPEHVAIVHNGVKITYAGFAAAISYAAGFLRQQLLEKGDTVAVIGPLLDSWVTVLALQSLGVDTVCMLTPSYIKHLSLNDVSTVVVPHGGAGASILSDEIEDGCSVVEMPEADFSSTVLSPDMIWEETGGHIVYTSGTTGVYKKLYYEAGLQQARLQERVDYARLSASGSCHCHSFGMWTSVGYKIPLAMWQARACVYFDERDDWFCHFRDAPMAEAILIPDMIPQLLDYLQGTPAPAPLPDFKLHVTAGFLSRDLAEALLGQVTSRLIVAYGSTETNVAVLQSTVSDLDDMHWLAPTTFHNVEIVNASGEVCPDGVEGELRVRLKSLDLQYYVDDGAATDKAFRQGCFYPGDMGIRRADGCIRILGRSADVVNFRGQKLAVAPIELDLQRRLGVSSVCLFSGISDQGEDEIVVVIESAAWPSKTQLATLSKELKQFDEVRFALVTSFPRTETGISKVNRRELREMVFAS